MPVEVPKEKWTGKVREVKPAMWVIAGLSLVFLSLEQLPGLMVWLRGLF